VSPEQVTGLTQTENNFSVEQDIERKGIRELISELIRYHETSRRQQSLNFSGAGTVSSAHYRNALEVLLDDFNRDPKLFESSLRTNFDAWEAHGEEGRIELRPYSLPRVKASSKQSAQFRAPLYRIPPDLVRVRLEDYATRFENFAEKLPPLRASGQGPIYARLKRRDSRGKEVIPLEPYPSRIEIEKRGLLANKRLELAWVEEASAETARNVGSVFLEMDGGKEVYLKEVAHNSREHSPAEYMSFFREEKSMEATTRLGSKWIPGRLAALDRRIYPVGTLALVIAGNNHALVATLDQLRSISGAREVGLAMDPAESSFTAGPVRLIFFVPNETIQERIKRLQSDGKAGLNANPFE
jgi:membrane-bound lytic murein transglycosylase